MRLKHADHDHAMVIHLEGDVCADEVQALRKLVSDRLNQRTTDFVLDLAAVEMIDSRGLETLLWIQDEVAERLGQVRLVGVNDTFGQILHVTRLNSRFTTAEDVSAAMGSLQ